MPEKGYVNVGTTLKKEDAKVFKKRLNEAGFKGVEGEGSLHFFAKAVLEGRFQFTGQPTSTLTPEETSLLGELHAFLKQLEASRKRAGRTGKKEADQARVLEKLLR